MSSLNIWKENPPRIKPLLVHFLTVPGIEKKKKEATIVSSSQREVMVWPPTAMIGLKNKQTQQQQ